MKNLFLLVALLSVSTFQACSNSFFAPMAVDVSQGEGYKGEDVPSRLSALLLQAAVSQAAASGQQRRPISCTHEYKRPKLKLPKRLSVR